MQVGGGATSESTSERSLGRAVLPTGRQGSQSLQQRTSTRCFRDRPVKLVVQKAHAPRCKCLCECSREAELMVPSLAGLPTTQRVESSLRFAVVSVRPADRLCLGLQGSFAGHPTFLETRHTGSRGTCRGGGSSTKIGSPACISPARGRAPDEGQPLGGGPHDGQPLGGRTLRALCTTPRLSGLAASTSTVPMPRPPLPCPPAQSGDGSAHHGDLSWRFGAVPADDAETKLHRRASRISEARPVEVGARRPAALCARKRGPFFFCGSRRSGK
jgi:hypothetical protein